MRYVVLGGGIAGVCCALELARCLQQDETQRPPIVATDEALHPEGSASSLPPDLQQKSSPKLAAMGTASETNHVILVSSSSVIKSVREATRLSRLVEELEVVESSLEDLATSAAVGGVLRVVQGTAVGLDLQARVLRLQGTDELQYDILCLCTGARPKELEVPGADHPAVMTLRDTDSVQDLARRLRRCRRLVLVGNGGIALELIGALTMVPQLQYNRHAAVHGPTHPQPNVRAASAGVPEPAPGGAKLADSGPESTLGSGVAQQPELVWILKHGHVGDAFFDLDAAQFLLKDRLQPLAAAAEAAAAALAPAPVPANRGAGAGAATSGSSTTADTTAAAASPSSGTGGAPRDSSGSCGPGRGDRGLGRGQGGIRGHAAGPAWTRELLRGLRLAQGPGGGVTAAALGEGRGGGGGGGEKDEEEEEAPRRQGDEAAAAVTTIAAAGEGEGNTGACGNAGGSIPFRLVLEFDTTVTQINGSGGGVCEGPAVAPDVDIDGVKWPVYVTLSNGKVYGADLVVCGIGVVPATDWLPPQLTRGSDGGVAVGRDLRTRDPHVFAAGDCCTADWPDGSPHWFQMRLWTQARVMGSFAARSMLGVEDELASGFNFELFTHVTRFLGAKVVLLGLYNGQRLENEPTEDIRLYSRVCSAVDGSGTTFVRVLLLRGRMQGAVLIGETELEEALENVILDGLDLSNYGAHILDEDFELEHIFD